MQLVGHEYITAWQTSFFVTLITSWQSGPTSGEIYTTGYATVTRHCQILGSSATFKFRKVFDQFMKPYFGVFDDFVRCEWRLQACRVSSRHKLADVCVVQYLSSARYRMRFKEYCFQRLIFHKPFVLGVTYWNFIQQLLTLFWRSGAGCRSCRRGSRGWQCKGFHG